MDRREWMKLMALSLGGSLSLPESVFAQMAEPFDPARLTFFTAQQRKLVAVLAETIIPETDTPGAIKAGVPGWIELLTQDCLEEKEQKLIREGLGRLEKRAEGDFKKSFEALSTDERIKLLTALERESKKPGGDAFIAKFKELTKFTYASSELGATQAFEFTLVPGRWEPAIPLKPGQKAYAM